MLNDWHYVTLPLTAKDLHALGGTLVLKATHCSLRLLGELMIRDGSNLAAGTALLKRLHFNSREILTGTNNHADGQLRCAAWLLPDDYRDRLRCPTHTLSGSGSSAAHVPVTFAALFFFRSAPQSGTLRWCRRLLAFACAHRRCPGTPPDA